MPKVTCQYHGDVVIFDKFSLCHKCAREFFERHGIPYDDRYRPPPVDDDVTEIELSDIIVELDEILLKEGERKAWNSSSRP